MIIDVNKLKYSGKLEADFAFLYTASENLLLVDDSVIDGPISVSVTVELHDSSVYVDGTVSCTIVGRCARCVEQAVYEFSTDLSVRYVLNNPEENDYLYKRGIVDLTDAVNEKIVTDAPTVIYCKDNCKGLCPKCGCNLNLEDCNCKI
ncbi:MAG: DUF177 domain-containing protein [Clostridia bacterium]|nr:DUF177 domain-containing protein [Clostridia bacterium]